MRIIEVNNSNLYKIIKEWQRVNGLAPAQHLWGYNTLAEYGVDVDVLPFERLPFIKKLSSWIKILGDLDQQLRILVKASEYDAIYSVHHFTTTLLSMCRICGLLKIPLLSIAYQSLRQRNLWNRLFTKLFVCGSDKILCLSETLMNDLIESGVPRKKLDLIEWGVDMRFYNAWKPADNLSQSPIKKKMILSIGNTYRDFDTLSLALGSIDCDLEIFASGRQPFRNIKNIPPNVKVAAERIPWKDIIEKYRQAYAVAIPILFHPSKPKNAIGLSSLMEAFAMGKAVVMTRNDYVGIDLEKEKIGIWIAPGDAEGWRQAINYLIGHPDIVADMGYRARQLAEKKYNLESFSNKLSIHLKDFDCKKSAPSVSQKSR